MVPIVVTGCLGYSGFSSFSGSSNVQSDARVTLDAKVMILLIASVKHFLGKH